MNGLKILAPQPTIHSEAIFQLADTEWPSIAEHCRRGRIAHSHLDWQVSRIGLLDDELAAYWGVYDLQMRIGAAQVRTAGVNLPVTHPDHRGRGYMPQIVASSLSAMQTHGYDLSVINNTHAYFTRLGYVTAWPQMHFYVETADLPTEAPDVIIEQVNMQHWIGQPDLYTLYNQHHQNLTGTAVRPTYQQGKHPHATGNVGFLLRNAAGSIVGYIYDDPPGKPDEWYEHSDSAGDVVQRLRVLGHLARQYQFRGIRFHRLHARSDLAIQLRQLNCCMEVDYRADSGYLIRVINLESTLRKMAAELSHRLQHSAYGDWSGGLLIALDDQQATITINQGQVQIGPPIPTPQRIKGGQAIGQLLIGAGEPLEIVERGGISLTGMAEPLVRALFPNQQPQMPNEDL